MMLGIDKLARLFKSKGKEKGSKIKENDLIMSKTSEKIDKMFYYVSLSKYCRVIL